MSIESSLLPKASDLLRLQSFIVTVVPLCDVLRGGEILLVDTTGQQQTQCRLSPHSRTDEDMRKTIGVNKFITTQKCLRR